MTTTISKIVRYRSFTSNSQPAPEFHPTERTGAVSKSAGQPTSTPDWRPKNAWADNQRTTLDVSHMTAKSLRSRMTVIAEQEKREWQTVDSREAWERFRDRRLGALRKWMGPMPERPFLILSHAVLTLFPTGLTKPRPVITTRFVSLMMSPKNSFSSGNYIHP